MRSVAEIFEVTRDQRQEILRSASGEPLRYLAWGGPSEELPFSVLEPSAELSDSGFFSPDDEEGSAIPTEEMRDQIARVVEYIVLVGLDCVLFLSPDMKVNFTRVLRGWDVRMLFRCGSEVYRRDFKAIASAEAVVAAIFEVVAELSERAELPS